MRPVRLLTLLVLVAACSSVHTVMAPDGSPAYYIKCRDRVKCLRHAQKVCPTGYEVLTGGLSEGAVIMSGGNVTTVEPTLRTEMMIRCRREE